MTPIATWVAKRGVIWLLGKQFSPEKRAARKQRRLIKRKNRDRKKLGLPPLTEEDIEMFGFRTSTVATIAGTITFVILKAVAFVAPELAADPQVEAGLAAVVAYLFARFNKTPTQPGVL